MNVPSYEALQNKDKLIKVIRELCEKMDKVENTAVTEEALQQGEVIVIAEQPIPSSWPVGSTHSMADLIAAINDDDTAVPGRMYLSTVRLSDLPYYDDNGTPTKLIQAEMKIEIMARQDVLGNPKDVILFTVTSTLPPYHWEYTSAWGNTGEWVAFKVG